MSERLRPQETKCREALTAAVGSFAQSRFELGRALSQYREIYKEEQKWMPFCGEVEKEGCPAIQSTNVKVSEQQSLRQTMEHSSG